jgi:hypothetical protein
MKKAIIFTVNDRDCYFEPTLNAWLNVRLINQYDIYFKIEPSNKLKEMQNLIISFCDKISIKANIIVNENNAGVLLNPWEAFCLMFDELDYGFVILAEDDIHPSSDALEYFNYCHQKYHSDDKVLAISAFNKDYEQGTDDTHIFKTDHFSCLIWGTWRDRWHKYLKDTWDKNYSSGTAERPESGWDWNINLRVIPQNKLKCVNPKISRSQHTGVVGTHMSEEMFTESQSRTFKYYIPKTTYQEISDVI